MYVLQFVDEKVQWMHIDIAGTVWSKRSGWVLASESPPWWSGFSTTRHPEETLQ